MKIVFDTNIFISGLLFKGGIPSRLLELAQDRFFELFISPDIRDELNQVLEVKFKLTLHERDLLLRWLEKRGIIVYPKKKIDLVKSCEPDNRILECALEAKADFLVTGDKKDLLSLKHSFEFKIISPGHFFRNVLIKS